MNRIRRITRRVLEISGVVSLSLLAVAFLAASLHGAQAEETEGAPSSPGTLEFVGKNFFSTAKGTFHEWRILDSHLDMDALEQNFAVVEVTLRSVDTGIDRRDAHLLEADFFEVETYPVALARVHSFAAKGESEAGNPLFSVEFDVDLHGVKKTLPGEIEVIGEAPRIVEGRLVIDRLEFGVGPPESRWSPMSIDSEIPVHFRVEI